MKLVPFLSYSLVFAAFSLGLRLHAQTPSPPPTPSSPSTPTSTISSTPAPSPAITAADVGNGVEVGEGVGGDEDVKKIVPDSSQDTSSVIWALPPAPPQLPPAPIAAPAVVAPFVKQKAIAPKTTRNNVPSSSAKSAIANRVLELPLGEPDTEQKSPALRATDEWLRADTSLRTIAAQKGLTLPLPQARIVVLKSQRRLELWSDQTLVKVYRVALGAHPSGAKKRQRDSRTPEGHFYICTRNSTTSAFHVFLGLSYPGVPDAVRGKKSGLISAREYQMIRNRLASRQRPLWETRLGGWVGIHGGTGNAYAQKQTVKRGRSDWTAGCIAVTNREIEEIYRATVLGTPVWIRP